MNWLELLILGLLLTTKFFNDVIFGYIVEWWSCVLSLDVIEGDIIIFFF